LEGTCTKPLSFFCESDAGDRLAQTKQA